MKGLDLAALPAEAWRPSNAVTDRASNRVNERELEHIPAWISLETGSKIKSSKDIPVHLWDYSPFGFAITFPFSESGCTSPKVGDLAKLKFDFGDGILTADCIVKNSSIVKNTLRIGLSRRDLARRYKFENRVGAPHGECLRLPEKSDIRAEVRNPILFAEWATFELCGVQTGFQLDFISRDANLPLFFGQKLELRFVMPTTGNPVFRGEVIFLERVPGNALKVRLKTLSITSALANDLAEALAFEADITPGMLKRFGFPTRFLKRRITFRFLETMEEYAQVLALRRSAYVDAGKKSGETQPEDMSISKDKNSRILCAYHDETLVACAAITFPTREDEVLRSESSFPNGKYPIPHPPKSELVEVNSLCTHKEYRRGDLLQAMFEQLARIFMLSGRTCIMNLVESSLLPIYLGIGFEDTGKTCDFLGRTHHLIRVERQVCMTARRIGMLRWNLLYGDLMEDILKRGMLPLGPFDRLRLKLMLTLKPFAKRWVGSKYERAFRRSLEVMEKNEDG
ncbi:MAG: GNAT family N-acetyltransferase [Fibrobacterota bacterium]|nr:GNAT family N-acetyltransferase [Fibrobacterota bacterium]